jgi:hypothetical protein
VNKGPIIVFGAFDRHNFGDMLFAHVVANLLAERDGGLAPVFAGCVGRDLREYGGHRVAALAEVATRWRDDPVTLIHAGGELLTCDAWEAAVMSMQPEDAQTCIARHGATEGGRRAFARTTLHTDAHAPYVIGRETFARAASICFDAVGGVTLDAREPAFCADVLARLRTADHLSVRDAHTQSILRAAGIDAPLVPDPAAMVAELFGARIRVHADRDEVAELRRAFARGYLALQFSADFADDATLARIAHQLDLLGESTGMGVVLFRAGAAPWHDDIAVYERAVRHMRHPHVRLFRSLNVWDICALIASSEGFAGSSLHGRIVAMAFGLPRVNIAHADAGAGTAKQQAYASAWEGAGMPGVAPIDRLHSMMQQALTSNRDALRHHATQLARKHRADFAAIAAIADSAAR